MDYYTCDKDNISPPKINGKLNHKYIYPYQWDVFSQALKVIRPFLRNEKNYAIYGERLASYTNEYGEYTEIFDFVVVDENFDAYHIFPECIFRDKPEQSSDIPIQIYEEFLNGKYDYTVSPIDFKEMHNIFGITIDSIAGYTIDNFKKNINRTNGSSKYRVQNISPYYATFYSPVFIARFDKSGQIHNPKYYLYHNKTIKDKVASELGVLLEIARAKDKNLSPNGISIQF